MSDLENELIVEDVAGACVILSGTPCDEKQLLLIGFSRTGVEWTREISGHSERLSVVSTLVELGALFSAGRDWSPADVVEYFRDQGEIARAYRRIAWKNPESYVIEEIPPRLL